jgi:hypothetical protein
MAFWSHSRKGWRVPYPKCHPYHSPRYDTLYPIPYTLYPKPYTQNAISTTLPGTIPYTLYPIPCTLNHTPRRRPLPLSQVRYPIPYTLYPTPSALNISEPAPRRLIINPKPALPGAIRISYLESAPATRHFGRSRIPLPCHSIQV